MIRQSQPEILYQGAEKRRVALPCSDVRSAPGVKIAAFLDFSPSWRDRNEGGAGNSFFPQPARSASFRRRK